MQLSQAELQAELDKIEKLRSSGVSSTMADGTKVDIDQDALAKRAKELRQQISAYRKRRPVASNIYLGGF